MIEEIRIENIGVIAQAHLELAPTLTVITGETGAGKTMVLTSLALLLGGRADPGLVRPGAARALVEGVVANPGAAVRERAEDAGAEVDDDALIIARAVPAEGRSRAWLGGRTVPQGVLAEIAGDIVAVHGQSDQLRLRSASQQRAALDDFAGEEHRSRISAYREAYAALGTARAALAEWDSAAATRQQELAALTAGLEAVEELSPVAGEDVALKEEADRLGHVEELRSAAQVAHAALSGSDDGPFTAADSVLDANRAVEQARRALEQAAHLDTALAGWAARLTEVAYLIGDVGVELGSYLTGLEADPARLEAVHRRRAALSEAVRKFAPARADGASPTLDDLLLWANHAGRRVAALSDPTHTREALARRLADAAADVSLLAGQISAGRARAARELAVAVDAELAGLAMPGAHLEIRLVPRDEPGPWGAEEVEMRLAGHPGAPAAPLGRAASGGELSRVMLAIEVALATAAGARRPPTFVFDEVDAGIGGRAAVEVGRRLAELSRSSQVVVVTHLAQVAAFADRHLVVTKTVREGHDVVTDSGVSVVEGEERARELARMLSGQEDSVAALRHAEELLARAGVRA